MLVEKNVYRKLTTCFDCQISYVCNLKGEDVSIREGYLVDETSRNKLTLWREYCNLLDNRSTYDLKNVVINNHPENQHNFRNIPRDVAANHREEKNIKIISDSIPRGLKMREFNSYIKGGRAHIKAFQGATAKRLHHYILPTLEEENPDIVILHVGYNDSAPKDNDLENINVKSVANEIINIGKMCNQHGVMW